MAQWKCIRCGHPEWKPWETQRFENGTLIKCAACDAIHTIYSVHLARKRVPALN